jgi:hypothetical protein
MPPEKVPVAIRRVVAARAAGYCEYCRYPEQFATESFTVEHITPRAAGGANTLDNLDWSCFGCNSFKHAKTQGTDPQTGAQVPLFHPRQQQWDEHFDWTEDKCQIVGKTSCGRATVEALRFNRVALMNLRGVLAQVGLHPPDPSAFDHPS